MKKSTIPALMVLCGLGSLPCGLVIHEMLFGGSGSIPKSSRVERDFLAIGNALKTYKINAGRYPSTDQGLDALVIAPKQGPKPRRWIQFMKEVPHDPWLTPYRYVLLEPETNKFERRFELGSAGADWIFGSSDDHVEEF